MKTRGCDEMTQEQIITLIISIVVLTAGVAYLYFYYKKAKRPAKKETTIAADTLLQALGGASNILSTALENKRLKISLENPKLVSQTLLKSMGIAGFLSGNELKLLVKDNPLEVKTNLDQLRSEVRR